MYCVYIHLCRTTGKIYVGQTKNTVQRWRMNGFNYKGKFKEAIDKYGWDNFDHFVVEDGLTQKEAYILEAKLIKKFKSDKRGYNVEPGAKKPLTVYNPETEDFAHFASRADAAKYLSDITGCSAKLENCNIDIVLDEKRGTYRRQGYFIFDGKISAKEAKRKAENIHEDKRNRGCSVEVIVSYPDGRTKTFLSANEAADATGYSRRYVGRLMETGGTTSDGIKFTRTTEFCSRIKAVKDDRELFFDSQREFARYVNASSSNVSNALKKPNKRTVKGWSLSYA